MKTNKTYLHILMHIGKLLELRINEALADVGIHHGQGRVLVNLVNYGKMTQADLARGLQIAPATLTKMLRPLEKRQLITRTIDKKTNRAMVIELTSEGKKLALLVQRAWRRIEQAMNETVPDSHNSQLFAHLENFREVLGGSEPVFVPYEGKKP